MTANLLLPTAPATIPAGRIGPAPSGLAPPPPVSEVPGRTLHGALHRSSAERVFGADGLRAALDDGRWTEPWSGVVLPSERAGDPLARAEAALLRAGPHAVLNGPTAVAMHGCTEAFDDRTVHVAVPYDRQLRPVPDLAIKQTWIREADVIELDGLRVYALDAALAEMLCTGERRTALACLEQALAVLGSAAVRFHAVVTEQVARRRDRRGTRRAAELLELARLGPSGAVPVVARIEAAAPAGAGSGGGL